MDDNCRQHPLKHTTARQPHAKVYTMSRRPGFAFLPPSLAQARTRC